MRQGLFTEAVWFTESAQVTAHSHKQDVLKGYSTQFYIHISLMSYWLNKFESSVNSDSIAEQKRVKK